MIDSTLERQVLKYLSPRGGSNSWSQSHHNISAWRRHSPADVRPLTLEFSPVLECNSNCPHCPYRQSRIQIEADRVPHGRFSVSNDRSVASSDTVLRVLNASAAVGIRGVIWTGGGEPTLLQDLPEMCSHARSLGMVNGIYTNGVLLGIHPELATQLLHPANGVAFIRMSINALSPLAVRRHWGVKDPKEVLVQLRGLERLLHAREWNVPSFVAESHDLPSIQISTIVDRHNVGDLLEICRTVASIFRTQRSTPGPEDVMIVRPVVDHRRAECPDKAHDPSAIPELLRVCGQDGPGRRELESAGVRLFLGFGLGLVQAGNLPSYSEVITQAYDNRRSSWANGLFLTVGPDANVYPCMEMNCDPKWVVGNLNTQSVEEIYRSTEYRNFISMANRLHWGPPLFHPHARSARLDCIARVIASGELSDDEIKSIRAQSLKSPPLLLD